jgi:hypothetical protein
VVRAAAPTSPRSPRGQQGVRGDVTGQKRARQGAASGVARHSAPGGDGVSRTLFALTPLTECSNPEGGDSGNPAPRKEARVLSSAGGAEGGGSPPLPEEGGPWRVVARKARQLVAGLVSPPQAQPQPMPRPKLGQGSGRGKGKGGPSGGH